MPELQSYNQLHPLHISKVFSINYKTYKHLRFFFHLYKIGYSGDMHPLIPVKCTHLLNYQFDKVILFFLNCLLLTRFYALCELPCL